MPHGDAALWARYESWTLRYVPMTVALTVADTISLPASALDALVCATAAFMAPRVPQGMNPSMPTRDIRSDHKETEHLFIKEIGFSRAAWNDVPKDVF